MTNINQDELRKLAEAATGGTWIAAPYSSVVGAPIVAAPTGRSIASVTYFALGEGFKKHDEESAANAALIVYLRNNVPAILSQADEIARLRKRLAYWAARPTITEALTGKDGPGEWAGLSVEQRIEAMGKRKREHDEEVLAARAALSPPHANREDGHDEG